MSSGVKVVLLEPGDITLSTPLCARQSHYYMDMEAALRQDMEPDRMEHFRYYQRLQQE